MASENAPLLLVAQRSPEVFREMMSGSSGCCWSLEEHPLVSFDVQVSSLSWSLFRTGFDRCAGVSEPLNRCEAQLQVQPELHGGFFLRFIWRSRGC